MEQQYDVQDLLARIEKLEKRSRRARILGVVAALFVGLAAYGYWQFDQLSGTHRFMKTQGVSLLRDVDKWSAGEASYAGGMYANETQGGGVSFMTENYRYFTGMSASKSEAMWHLWAPQHTINVGIGANNAPALLMRDKAGSNEIAIGMKPDGTPYFDVTHQGQKVYQLPIQP